MSVPFGIPCISIYFQNWKEYDRSDNFPFDYKPNGIPFGLKSNEKPSDLRLYSFEFEGHHESNSPNIEESILCNVFQSTENRHRQTCSCPRDWRLLASGGPIESPLETPRISQRYRIERIKGVHYICLFYAMIPNRLDIIKRTPTSSNNLGTWLYEPYKISVREKNGENKKSNSNCTEKTIFPVPFT